MELVKKNIHMNKIKCKSNVQLTLDDDFNVPDIKPDIDRIIKEQGEVRVTDVKTMSGKLMVKGIMKFNVLYLSEDDVRPIHNISGEIPFDEVVNMDEICSEDNVNVKWELEDLSTSLINSRKLSVKSIVSFQFTTEDIYNEETAVGIDDMEYTQVLNKTMNITQIAMNKKDTFRIKDEINLPLGKANIFEILYYEVNLMGTDIRMLEDKLSIKGELGLFVLYSGEDEENPIQYMETDVPFSGTIDCNGCREDMISDIDVKIQSKDLEIKPDSDGEERVIDLEVILDLEIKAYEEEELEILRDVYSTKKELVPVFTEASYENLLMKNNSKAKISDQIKTDSGTPRILQICNASGNVKIDEITVVDNGLEVNGIIEVHILYITEDDKKPLNSTKGVIPFSQVVEIKDIKEGSVYDVKAGLEQMNVMLLDGEEMEIRANINLNAIVFDKIAEPIITGLEIAEIDLEHLNEMPSVIGYIAKAGDSLWNIAKRFYTTVDSIKEVNGLSQDKLTVGEKLLILKKVDAIL